MKRSYITILLTGCLAFAACEKNESTGSPAVIEPDYILPQGDASSEDNARIQDLYDVFGSYFLYNVTQKDFEWVLSTGSSNARIDSIVLGDPQYVGDMLDFLDEVWLKFLPAEFKKGPGLPYRILLVDTIKQRRAGTGYPPGMEYLYFNFKVVGKAFTFAGMNESLRTMSATDKRARRNELQTEIWNYYLNNGIVSIPEEFYEVSNYVTAPQLPVNVANPQNIEAYRQRGFLPSGYLTNGNPREWYTSAYFWGQAHTYDINSYLLHLIQRTDAEMAAYLTYPLIKQKFDLLVAHFNDEYGIDVRAIANKTY